MSWLDEIRERLEKATPGPWIAEGMGVFSPEEGWICSTENSPQQEIPDAEFIAHARTDIERLLRVAEAAEKMQDVDLRDLDEAYPAWKALDDALTQNPSADSETIDTDSGL